MRPTTPTQSQETGWTYDSDNSTWRPPGRTGPHTHGLSDLGSDVTSRLGSVSGSALGRAVAVADGAAVSNADTDLSVTITVPAGRLLKITMVEQNLVGTVVGDGFDVTIQEGSTVLQDSPWFVETGNTQPRSLTVMAVTSPTAGTHTYKGHISRFSGTGTLQPLRNASVNAFLLVEDITGSVWPAGSQVTAGLVASEAWTTYTPALTGSTTNPTLGSGNIITGRWIQYGKLVFVNFYVKFGSSGTNQGVGLYRVGLPVTAKPPIRNSFAVGLGWGFNAAAILQYAGVELVGAGAGGIADRVEMRNFANGLQVFTDAVPFTWGANMEIVGSATYEAA